MYRHMNMATTQVAEAERNLKKSAQTYDRKEVGGRGVRGGEGQKNELGREAEINSRVDVTQ